MVFQQLAALDGGQHVLLLNDGEGVFTPFANSGLEEAVGKVAAGAVFADFDGDTHLDVFIAGGSTLARVADEVFFGNGDGTFVAGTLNDAPAQPSNGAVTCDVDNDGDLDVLVSTYSVSTDNGHNHLWRNDGDRTFKEVGVKWGFAAQLTGNRWMKETGKGSAEEPGAGPRDAVGSNGFGIDCGDLNNDGLMDVWFATISHPDSSHERMWSDPSQVLLGDGTALTDVTGDLGVPFNEGDIDAAMVDFDLDGQLDLSVTRERKYEERYKRDEQKGWLGLFWQQDDGQYASLGLDSGINDLDGEEGIPVGKGGQNLAWADIDHDGDPDLFFGGRSSGRTGRANALFRNDVGQDNRWLKVRLRGDVDTVHPDAFGARIVVSDGETTLTREQRSGRGTYTAQDGSWLTLGLADLNCLTEAVVQWPNGQEVALDVSLLGENQEVIVRYPDLVEVFTP